MPYLIDSDWVIDHLLEVPAATALLATFQSDLTYVSIVTYMEVFQGTLREPDPAAALSKLKAFIDQAPILHFDEAAAERCARLRDALRFGAVRPNRRSMDLMIAATAIENGLTLVTRNVDDFDDIPDLLLHRT